MKRSPARRYARATVTAVVGAALLAGCSDKVETSPAAAQSEPEQVQIVVDPAETDQLILGEVFRQSLLEEGRTAELKKEETFKTHGGKGSSLNPEGNFYVGCTGSFLSHFNPGEARNISAEYKKTEEDSEPGGEDFLARTHIALMSTLPTQLATVEPSGAHGCEDAQPELPENFVVIYSDNLFDREEEKSVAAVTKFITQKDISDMVEAIEEGEELKKVVHEWMEASGMDIVNEESDSGSSGGSDLSSS